MLAAFIEKTRSDQFKWGVNDCALWCASAVQSAIGHDPAAGLRGTYNSRFECRQIIMAAGGLVSLVAPRMAHSDLRDLSGDGVAVLQFGKTKICGLIVDGRAVLKTEKGLQMLDEFTILRGWSW